MLRPFTLHEPTTVEEATSLLADLGGAARPYAGGTELLLAMKAGVLAYDHLVNVKTVAGLDGIALDGGVLRVGSAVTHRELEASPVLGERFALLAGVERRVANVRVRNVGTLGGNLCFAEPHSDPGTALLLYDALGATFRKIKAKADPACALCGPQATITDLDAVSYREREPFCAA